MKPNQPTQYNPQQINSEKREPQTPCKKEGEVISRTLPVDLLQKVFSQYSDLGQGWKQQCSDLIPFKKAIASTDLILKCEHFMSYLYP